MRTLLTVYCFQNSGREADILSLCLKNFYGLAFHISTSSLAPANIIGVGTLAYNER